MIGWDYRPKTELQGNEMSCDKADNFDFLCGFGNDTRRAACHVKSDTINDTLLLQCCTFEGLRFSQVVGVTPIGPGEAVTGGEVVRDGRQISFDVIANIRKVVSSEEPKICESALTHKQFHLKDK
ncbi:hypothetical protein NECAME_10536 [Necator americanus]|uniref:Uncharacterized protein n=1 Tax=Necator americanus TaxID=51031 RepID=W2TAD8_NECAM|nr:hypothetical protein NECAME_10536 [Necator americanus]ETN78161.1 hypothetical protein NECAME_10536 [Necator americanus]